MNEKSLKILEYNKIIDMLIKHASCEPGRQMCAQLLPSTDAEEVRTAQAETAAAADRIRLKGRISFGDVRELGASVKRLEVHAPLSMSELMHVASLLNNAERAIKYGRHEKDDETYDCLEGYFTSLDGVQTVARAIEHCIISEEEMADDASSELKAIRRKMHSIDARMHTELNGTLNQYRAYLMDSVITLKDGAYCLPVRAEYKTKVPGVVHDQSSTGSTVFIEPMSAIKLNNELRELEAEEKKEIAKILAELSEKCEPIKSVIMTDVKVMTKLDFIYAKASLAGAMRASEPVINTEGIIDIKDGRHPLLSKDKVVPISIKLGEDYDLLIITGPNTGGKTVSLKTVGLFTLMAQAGLHIPAFDKSRIAVFKEVFADIGDEQSIEQSLSTFSGHMKNIVEIVDKADGESLCLFDELGAGTDPTEGAALAISVLSFLHRMQVRTMATTHYSELKVFALTTPGVENASCEFDVETLRPTYRILTGIPGKSNAFAISKKLGLPQHIIDEAGQHIEKNDARFEDLIAKLNNDRVQIEKDREQIRADKEEIEKLKKRHQSQDENLDERKEKILREAREEAQKILSEAKETADDTIRNINKITQDSGLGKQLEKERERLRANLKSVESEMGFTVKKKIEAKGDKPLTLHQGDKVHVISMNLDGTVSTLPNDKGMFFVQMGILRSQVSVDDVYILEETTDQSKKIRAERAAFAGGLKSATISHEINVIGKNVDEACSELDKYLDDAMLSHLPKVRIIHGRGTGALKKGIHAYLKKQKFIKKFYSADFNDGGEAITVVEFK